MQLTFRFTHILCAFSFLATVFSGYALDMSGIKSGLKKSYYRFWLIHPISTVAEANISDWCSQGIQVTKVAQEKVLEKYEAPRWVTWLSTISPEESMFDYAYDIYKKIQIEMVPLMNAIDGKDKNGKEIDDKDKIDKTQLIAASQTALYTQEAAWRALEQKLIYILGAEDANRGVTEKDIFNNVKETLAILDALISVLNDLTLALPKQTIRTPSKKAFQDVAAQKEKTAEKVMQFTENQQRLNVKKEKLRAEAQAVRMRLGRFIGKDICGKEKLTPERLSRLERWHRKKQAEWLANYVNNVCRACALR